MPHICLLLYGPPVFLPVEIVLGEAKFADRDAQLYSGVLPEILFYFDFEIEESFWSGKRPRRMSLRKCLGALQPNGPALWKCLSNHLCRSGGGRLNIHLPCPVTPIMVLPSVLEDLVEWLSKTDGELRSTVDDRDGWTSWELLECLCCSNHLSPVAQVPHTFSV